MIADANKISFKAALAEAGFPCMLSNTKTSHAGANDPLSATVIGSNNKKLTAPAIFSVTLKDKK